MKHEHLLQAIANHIASLPSEYVLKIGIDGVDGVGKTTFADELALTLKKLDRKIIRATVDSFHNPKDVRYQLGRRSPEGFFYHSYNYEALKTELLEPLSQKKTAKYRTEFFKHEIDSVVDAEYQQSCKGDIFIFDGIFLHRKELVHYWDFSVFLQADFEITIPRGSQRGFGLADPNALENHRYVEGQRIYLRTANPQSHASIVINYNDLENPSVDSAHSIISLPSS